jgi:hypothetical protein
MHPKPKLVPIGTNQLKYLSFQKVIPKDNYHDLKVHRFYIYCYLDPFKPVQATYTVLGKPFTFGYEPLYIGKASSNHGYRHNQHIAEFLKGKDSEEPYSELGNQIKTKKFQELDKQIKENNNPNLPSSWDEYQKTWIIILEHFDTAPDLIEAEKAFIHTIGTIAKNSGPLVNATFG